MLVVLDLLGSGVLLEPTLSISTWFEGRREVWCDSLLAVSACGHWAASCRPSPTDSLRPLAVPSSVGQVHGRGVPCGGHQVIRWGDG